MSAWLVSHDHIRLITQGYSIYGDGVYADLNALASYLYEENVNSINARYPNRWNEDGTMVVSEPVEYYPVIVHADAPGHFKALVLKALHCYRYQSCEHDGWEDCEARRMIKKVEENILTTYPKKVLYADGEVDLDETVPGFRDAPWDFRDYEGRQLIAALLR